MRTSYGDIFLLACCLALLLVNKSALIAMNGLVGYALAGSKAFATAGVTPYVLGSALSAMPAALWMAKVGRQTQGLNDLIVFAVMGVSSLSSGAWVDGAGWVHMNAVALPFIALVALAAGGLAMHSRRAAIAVRAPRAVERRGSRP